MGRSRKRRGSSDPLEAYRKIRKPMPPPERVMPDKRRKLAEREAQREAEREAEREAQSEAERDSEPEARARGNS